MSDAPADSIVRNYDDLIAALKARQAELGLTVEKIDELSGLPSGYTGKLLGASQVKSLGPMSLGVLLDTLGLQLMVTENVETTQRMRGRWDRRQRPNGHTQPRRIRAEHKKFPAVLFSILGKRSAEARMRKTTAEQRSRSARKAVNARWARWRIARRARRARRGKRA